MSRETRLKLREEVRDVFTHAYGGYMECAFPAGELLPLSCGPGYMDLAKVTCTAKSYSSHL